MFHWQWFILVITISFVVSNGGERINKRVLGLHLGSNSKKDTERKKLSTHIRFPLWVSISSINSVGAETQFKNISANLYEITLPFVVLVRESDVLVNRSAKQDKNLAFPFWVEITHVNKGTYANETVNDIARLSFPFELEVGSMHLVGLNFQLEPQTRATSTILETAIAGTVVIGAGTTLGVLSIVGTVAGLGVPVIALACVVGAVVVAHVVRAAIATAFKAAVEIFRPHDHRYGHVEPAKSVVGEVVGSVAGAVVSFVPGLGDVIRGGIKHMFQTFGDSLVTFVQELLTFRLVGDSIYAINVIIQFFSELPFLPWRRVIHRLPPGQLPKPPPIITPSRPQAPFSDMESVVVIRIYYGQVKIPAFPGYIIAWPGQMEPRVTDQIILRPIIPTIPMRPNIHLAWPIQSISPQRPNIVLIQPGQVFIPGYVNVIILWPGQPEPIDEQLIVIHQNQGTIPNIVGVVLLWPDQIPHQPIVIRVLPGQRQHPDFPTLIFRYPGDPEPPFIPGMTVVSPPMTEIPNHPGIVVVWPGAPPPLNTHPILVAPDDFQIPGMPNVMIYPLGHPRPPQQPGLTYITHGQREVPGYPGISLHWLPQHGPPLRIPISCIFIPPGAQYVPGFPEYGIARPGGPRPNTPKLVEVGNPTLPDNLDVILTWLERPPDLALRPSPEMYNAPVMRRGRRSVGKSPASVNVFETSLSPDKGILRIHERKYIWLNSTFDNIELDNMNVANLGETKSAHDKEPYPKPWSYDYKESHLRQRFKHLFGLSGQG